SDGHELFCYLGAHCRFARLTCEDRLSRRGVLATEPFGAPAVRRVSIPVRKITDDDLRWALRAGLGDFQAMRGDLVFAGLIYTVIGVAAAVMTTNGPLMPFFFPVVGGVGLLGPVASVGFYELARRREDGLGSGWGHFFVV